MTLIFQLIFLTALLLFAGAVISDLCRGVLRTFTGKDKPRGERC